MKTAKLYLAKIASVDYDGENWDIFASDADTIEEATEEARSWFEEEGSISDDYSIELYEQPVVCGYKVTLKK